MVAALLARMKRDVQENVWAVSWWVWPTDKKNTKIYRNIFYASRHSRYRKRYIFWLSLAQLSTWMTIFFCSAPLIFRELMKRWIASMIWLALIQNFSVMVKRVSQCFTAQRSKTPIGRTFMECPLTSFVVVVKSGRPNAGGPEPSTIIEQLRKEFLITSFFYIWYAWSSFAIMYICKRLRWI